MKEIEENKLKTFASALYTAIRNAIAYAELARISAENAYAAAHDPLTGLANRRRLYDLTTAMFEDGAVKLCHPHCAKFCVLGGGNCSG